MYERRDEPQGSILGPFLLLLHTNNNMSSWLQDALHTVVYADRIVFTIIHIIKKKKGRLETIIQTK